MLIERRTNPRVGIVRLGNVLVLIGNRLAEVGQAAIREPDNESELKKIVLLEGRLGEIEALQAKR